MGGRFLFFSASLFETGELVGGCCFWEMRDGGMGEVRYLAQRCWVEV